MDVSSIASFHNLITTISLLFSRTMVSNSRLRITDVSSLRQINHGPSSKLWKIKFKNWALVSLPIQKLSLSKRLMSNSKLSLQTRLLPVISSSSQLEENLTHRLVQLVLDMILPAILSSMSLNLKLRKSTPNRLSSQGFTGNFSWRCHSVLWQTQDYSRPSLHPFWPIWTSRPTSF